MIQHNDDRWSAVEVPEPVSSFLSSREHLLLIDGQHVSAEDGRTFPTFNPASGETLAQVSKAGARDVDKAVRAARVAFESGPWSRMSPFDRERVLRHVADLLEERREEFAVLETIDSGKPIRNTRRNDIPASIDTLRYFAGWPSKLRGATAPVSLTDWQEGERAHSGLSFTLREPVGVVAAIAPWNFPLEIICTKLAPALAAGNTVVCKPAEQTPLTAALFGTLLLEAGLPEGVVNVLQGDEETGDAMVRHPDIDMVTFTGQCATGQKVTAAAAGNLKKVILELGGKNPFIVFRDADLAAAAKHAAVRAFDCSGQVCIAGSRLYIEDDVYTEVRDLLIQEATHLQMGPGLSPGTTLGPLVSNEQLARVEGYVNTGIQQGAEAIVGGARPQGELIRGYFFPPTVLAGAKDDDVVNQEEIFGPVVSTMSFSDVNDVLRRALATPFGLMAYVWSNDINKALTCAQKLRTGMVRINGGGGDQSLPFGGRGMSGHGREQGSEGVEEFTYLKSVSVRLTI